MVIVHQTFHSRVDFDLFWLLNVIVWLMWQSFASALKRAFTREVFGRVSESGLPFHATDSKRNLQPSEEAHRSASLATGLPYAFSRSFNCADEEPARETRTRTTFPFECVSSNYSTQTKSSLARFDKGRPPHYFKMIFSPFSFCGSLSLSFVCR